MTAVRILGKPVAQPRPRHTGRQRRPYTRHPGLEAWQNALRLQLPRAKPAEPPTACHVELVFLIPRPLYMDSNYDAGVVWCPVRPDADNLAKPVLDAMTDLEFWPDDSVVVALTVTKVYHELGGKPGCIVSVHPMTHHHEPNVPEGYRWAVEQQDSTRRG